MAGAALTGTAIDIAYAPRIERIDTAIAVAYRAKFPVFEYRGQPVARRNRARNGNGFRRLIY
jgi:hypothetical protein